MRVSRMTKAELEAFINSFDHEHGDEDQLDAAYDELDRRREEADLRDTREEDEQAAFDDRYQAWRNEY